MFIFIELNFIELETEQILIMMGSHRGSIPTWLKGALIRNGPGTTTIGSTSFGHIFDEPSLLHRFAIESGNVTYNCRYLCSETYKKNRAANRIVVTEFGTKKVLDPCHTIFDRVASIFEEVATVTDNANVSVYPFGDELYALTESPATNIHRIDPDTLETLGTKKLNQTVLVHHTAHPHVMPNGDVYNIGSYVIRGQLKYAVVKFPFSKKDDMFKSAQIVASTKPRWKFSPTYMHSFGITDNYFIIVEQPLALCVSNLLYVYFKDATFSALLQAFPEYETQIVVIQRNTGEEKRYLADPFFFFHAINAFETDDKLIMDMCCYKDSSILQAMYTKAVESMQSNPEYKSWCHTRPKRFEIPLNAPDLTRVEPRIIADIGLEAPRINYDYNGKHYRYFYGVNPEVDAELPGALQKIDTYTGKYETWYEADCYPSEPVFVPSPDAKEEDDGVVLSVVLRGKDEYSAELLILDGRSFKEIGRAQFTTPSPVPKCFHGWFLPQQAT